VARPAESRSEVLSLLSDPSFINGGGASDPELYAAFQSSLGNFLNSWCGGAVVGTTLPAYFVAEAIDERVGASGQRTLLDGHRSGRWVANHPDRFTVRGVEVGPVAQRTCVLPTRSNQLGVSRRGDNILLDVPITCRADLRDVLSSMHRLDALDIYCDPGRNDPLAVLQGFQTLLSCPWTVCEQVFPDQQVPPIWRRLDEEGASVGVAELAEYIAHPFVGRFARIPLTKVVAEDAITQDDTGHDVIQVRVDCAGALGLSELLQGRLYVNHTLFWNRVVYVHDSKVLPSEDSFPFRMPDRSPESARPLLLECRFRGRSFHDSRWAFGSDPAGLVRVTAPQDASGRRRFGLEFNGLEQVPLNEVRLVYVAPVSWDAFEISPNDTLVESSRVSSKWRAKTKTAVGAEVGDGGAFPNAVAGWLVRGRGSLPAGRAVTRHEIADLVWKLVPGPLKRSLKPRSASPFPLGADLQTVMRTLPSGPFRGRAAPVTIITLALDQPDEGNRLGQFTQWLQRAVEAHCWFGSSIEIRLK